MGAERVRCEDMGGGGGGEGRWGITVCRLCEGLDVVRLVFFDGAVVIDEYKGLLVARVNVARSALVPGAEVALRVVIRERNLRRRFLLSSALTCVSDCPLLHVSIMQLA